MKKVQMMFACACTLAMCGCFTWHETEPVQVQMSAAPKGKDITIALSGFAATITEYIPVYGYETVYVDRGVYGRRGRRRGGWYGGHYETATTETLIPQTRANEAYRLRAQATLEENGFRNAVIKSVTAAYDKTLKMQGRK